MPVTKSLLLSALLMVAGSQIFSQDMNNPGDYMTAISKAHTDMDTKYMQYLSAVAHGRRARKVEKLRQQVIESISNCKYNTLAIPRYKDDNSLRQSNVDYIQLCYNVFNEDYKKIVNMEELAEQSFDEMQAYLLLEEKVDERLHEATVSLKKAEEDFAAKYNVKLVEDKSPLGGKMETAGKLNKYTNKIYLIYFKCNWEDNQMVTAMNNKKLNDIEQARSALSRYATEGLQALDSLRSFEGDPALASACRQTLNFYKNSADKQVPLLTDYFLKEEEFAKLKKNFEAKSDHSKADVDEYNKAVKDINNAVKSFNQTNTNLNNSRNQTMNEWQDANKQFADAHMPHFR